jgi:hypothetical protein
MVMVMGMAVMVLALTGRHCTLAGRGITHALVLLGM